MPVQGYFYKGRNVCRQARGCKTWYIVILVGEFRKDLDSSVDSNSKDLSVNV